MRYLCLLLIPLLVLFTACDEVKPVLMTQREIVVVKPNPATFEMCPKTLDLVIPDDTFGGNAEIRRIYSAYNQCRQTVTNLQREIEELEQVATKDNPKPKP